VNHILITGGSRGIGAQIFHRLKGIDGYDNVHHPERDELDLSDSRSITEYAHRHRQVGFNVIVNCAGVNHINWIEETDAKEYAEMFQVNVHAPFELIRHFVPQMKERQYGRIVNIASLFGPVISKEKRSVYSATKAAVVGMTKSLAIELGPYNILVNSVSPGYIETDMTRQNNTPTQIESIKQTIPLRKLGSPQHVADLVSFLVGSENNYITGQNIVIDGGLSIC
jgi:3-oxoacyl-[acyl-carrier protein] reductase